MRADKYFAEKFGSRTKSAQEISKGHVLVNGKAILPKDEIKENDVITFIEPDEKFVSNGGYKLSKALKTFNFSVQQFVCVDIGASTGGFTDCLLQNGASKVYAVDVGESLLDEKISNDERVVVMDNTNARFLNSNSFQEKIDCIVTDVSFISLKHIFPVIYQILSENGVAFVLIKPQFECENKHIGKSGIVSPSFHKKIVETVLGYAKEYDFSFLDIVNAPIRKGKNIEYVLLLQKKKTDINDTKVILNKVVDFVKLNAEDKLE